MTNLSVLMYGLLLFITIVIQLTVLTKTAGAAYKLSNRTASRTDKTNFERQVDGGLGHLQKGVVMFLPSLFAIPALAYGIFFGLVQRTRVLLY